MRQKALQMQSFKEKKKSTTILDQEYRPNCYSHLDFHNRKKSYLQAIFCYNL